MSVVSKLNVDDLKTFLLEQGFSSEVASAFQEHGIDGAIFGEMTDNHFCEVAPKIGDRVKLKRIQDNEKSAADKVFLN